MTNEEAIKMLKSKMDGHTDTSWEWTETVRIAINAIEAVDYDCANCIWYLKANNSDYPDLEEDEREREEEE